MKRKADQDRYIREYHKKLYMTDPKFKHKNRIRLLTWRMVKRLEIEKKYECEICGRWPTECHHLSYDKPNSATDIIWVCRACHVAFHRLKDD